MIEQGKKNQTQNKNYIQQLEQSSSNSGVMEDQNQNNNKKQAQAPAPNKKYAASYRTPKNKPNLKSNTRPFNNLNSTVLASQQDQQVNKDYLEGQGQDQDNDQDNQQQLLQGQPQLEVEEQEDDDQQQQQENQDENQMKNQTEERQNQQQNQMNSGVAKGKRQRNPRTKMTNQNWNSSGQRGVDATINISNRKRRQIKIERQQLTNIFNDLIIFINSKVTQIQNQGDKEKDNQEKEISRQIKQRQRQKLLSKPSLTSRNKSKSMKSRKQQQNKLNQRQTLSVNAGSQNYQYLNLNMNNPKNHNSNNQDANINTNNAPANKHRPSANQQQGTLNSVRKYSAKQQKDKDRDKLSMTERIQKQRHKKQVLYNYKQIMRYKIHDVNNQQHELYQFSSHNQQNQHSYEPGSGSKQKSKDKFKQRQRFYSNSSSAYQLSQNRNLSPSIYPKNSNISQLSADKTKNNKAFSVFQQVSLTINPVSSNFGPSPVNNNSLQNSAANKSESEYVNTPKSNN